MSIEREGDWLVWNPTGNFVRRFSLNNLLAVDTRAASLSRMEQFFSMRKATSRIAEGAFRIEAELVYFEELADEPVVPGGEDAFEPAPVEFMASTFRAVLSSSGPDLHPWFWPAHRTTRPRP